MSVETKTLDIKQQLREALISQTQEYIILLNASAIYVQCVSFMHTDKLFTLDATCLWWHSHHAFLPPAAAESVSLKDPVLMSKHATAGRLVKWFCFITRFYFWTSCGDPIQYYIKVNKTVTQQYKVINDKSFNNNSLIYNFGSKCLLSSCGFMLSAVSFYSLSITSLFLYWHEFVAKYFSLISTKYMGSSLSFLLNLLNLLCYSMVSYIYKKYTKYLSYQNLRPIFRLWPTSWEPLI